MLALCLRTDKQEAELYLFSGQELLTELKWEAHRKLAESLHLKIKEALSSKGLSIADIEKLCVYQGPGSFTGLRIGLSVANTLAYALEIPISGAEGEDWLKHCLQDVSNSKESVVPTYGSDPHTTQQKK